MASPLTVRRNNYHINKKSSDIMTPTGISYFLFEELYSVIDTENTIVFDPACGEGSLLQPFEELGLYCIGNDIQYQDSRILRRIKFHEKDFLQLKDLPFSIQEKDFLILCNPPFNNGKYGRKLMPELFLKKIFYFFGEKAKVVLFCPMGFRLNQRIKSKRYRYYRDDCIAEITSIVSLPLDVFKTTEFHQEILLWNIQGLKPHYWIPDSYLKLEEK